MGECPRWYQLYWSRDEQLVDSFIHRAEAIGAGALVVTLDTTMLGWRPADLDLGSLPFSQGIGIAQYTSDPGSTSSSTSASTPASRHADVDVTLGAVARWSISRRHPGRSSTTFARRSRVPPSKRSSTSTPTRRSRGPHRDAAGPQAAPVVLKGILHPDDARRALDLGVDAVMGPTTAAARSTARSAPSTRWSPSAPRRRRPHRAPRQRHPRWRRRLQGTRSRRRRGDPRPPARLRPRGRRRSGVADVVRNVIAELDLVMGLIGIRIVDEIDRDRLVTRARAAATVIARLHVSRPSLVTAVPLPRRPLRFQHRGRSYLRTAREQPAAVELSLS